MKTLVIDVDSLRPDHVGAYGYGPETTPRIDEFAADATVFERAYAANSPCMPARAGLLSGRYGVHNGVATHGPPGQTLTGVHRRNALPGRAREWFTLPELCFRNRVPTVAVSSFPRHPAPWFYHLWHEFRQPQEPSGGGEYFQTPRGEAVADLTIDALDRRADGDFLAYAQFWDPHTPYQRPDEEVERFADVPLPEHPTAAAIEDHRGWDTWRNARSEGIGSREDLRRTLAAYDAEIRYVDEQIGRLLDALRDRGVYEETLVVLLADHGEAFGEHGRYREHGDVHEPTQRVPLLVKPPASAASSSPSSTHRSRTDALVTNVDLAPTVADYAGLDAPARWQGRSLRPLLAGTAGTAGASDAADSRPDWRDRVVVEHGLYTAQRAVVEDRWKFVRTYHPGQWGPVTPSRALFDLDADPAEREDRAADEPAVVDRLERELAHWVERHVGPAGDALRSVASSRPVGLRWATEEHDGLPER